MKFTFATCFCLLFYSLCIAQSDNVLITKKVNDKIIELKNQGVDTIICSYVICVGSRLVYRPDTCASKDPKYLLWVKGGVSFIQRFDECLEYLQMLLAPQFFKVLKNNFAKIEKENLRYPEYSVVVKGKKRFLGTIIDHSCHTIIEIHVPDKLIEKNIDDFALETKYVEGHPNKNYYPNQKSSLNLLKNIIERDVNIYDTSVKVKTKLN